MHASLILFKILQTLHFGLSTLLAEATMDSAPGNTSSTPSQETSAAASQLEGKTTLVSRHSLCQVPQESHLPHRPKTQPPAFAMAPSQVPQKEADAQADSQDNGDLSPGRPVLQSSQTGCYSWSPPNPPPGSYTPNALSSRETDEQQVPPSAPEKPQKAKKYHPSGSKAKYVRAVPVPRSGTAGSPTTVKKSIELLHAQRDQIVLQQRREKDEGRKRELESKARRIENRILRLQIVEAYFAKSPPAQVPEEGGKEDQPLLAPKHATPLRSEDVSPYPPAREEQPPPEVLPVAAPGPVHDRLEKPAPCEPGSEEDRPDTPRTPVQAEQPSRPEPRESPEDEWTEIKLEDVEILLGHEGWEDDIVSNMIPNGHAPNAWWLNMNP